jgi:ribosomal protein S6--L-glutamate ligase
MHLCFVVESRYRCDSMPLKVAERLAEWDHEVTIIEPAGDPLNIGTFLTQPFDAVVLKTVADGPGLNVLELATARGLITINRLRAIRRARDKAAAIGLAMRFGLPVPQTWFAPTIDQFARLPQSLFPMIIKPANGSSNECIHLAVSNKDISDLADLYRHDEPRFWLAQRYVSNPGVDLKLYATGEGIYAEVRTSPLVASPTDPDRLIPVPAELEALVTRVGRVFDLDIFGIDLVQGPDGWIIVDVNDFPSFRLVPNAAGRVAETVLRLAGSRQALLPGHGRGNS